MGLGGSLVAVVGILGNALSALVLSRPKMKTSLNCLLLGLTASDTLLILSTLVIFSIGPILDFFEVGGRVNYSYFSTLLTPYLYSLGMTGRQSGISYVCTISVVSIVALDVHYCIFVLCPSFNAF
jgi:hypothetical protein